MQLVRRLVLATAVGPARGAAGDRLRRAGSDGRLGLAGAQGARRRRHLRRGVSGDGRYVAFATAARNLFGDDVVDPPGEYYSGGIFRRDVAGGALELVALGDLRSEADGTFVRSGAANPSISRDGRYVAFSTGRAARARRHQRQHRRLRARHGGAAGGPAPTRSCSALDGTDTPATYDGPGGIGAAGADVTTGMAISGDGGRVVFRTAERVSDLSGPDTPPFEVYVRDLATRRTHLITHERGTPTPVGGAIGGAGISARRQHGRLDGRQRRPSHEAAGRRAGGLDGAVLLPLAAGRRRRHAPRDRRDRPRRSRLYRSLRRRRRPRSPLLRPAATCRSGLGGDRSARAVAERRRRARRCSSPPAPPPRSTQGITLDLFADRHDRGRDPQGRHRRADPRGHRARPRRPRPDRERDALRRRALRGDRHPAHTLPPARARR